MDHVLYACEGDSVTLPWTYALDTGDTINQIEWYYHGASEEMIAIQAHGGFFAYPAFANRALGVGNANAGLILSHVITSDSGNYTVVVSCFDTSGVHFELWQSVVLQVSGKYFKQIKAIFFFFFSSVNADFLYCEFNLTQVFY